MSSQPAVYPYAHPHPQTHPHPHLHAPRLRIPAEQRSRVRVRPAWVLSTSLLASVVLVILVATVGMALGIWRFVVIDTGSMRPTLNPGDVAILTSEPIADLEEGQIVAFHPPGEPRLTVTHRVFSIDRTPSGVVIQTKGDANNATDAWHARLAGNTVWRESLKVPAVGYLVVWAQQRPVRLAVLVVIVIFVVSMSMSWIWRPRQAESPRIALGPAVEE